MVQVLRMTRPGLILKLRCPDQPGIVAKVSGNPELTWYKDGVPIKMDSRISCKQVDPETFELNFTKTTADDNGNW